MTRTFVKGRTSRNKKWGYKRVSSHYSCHGACCWNPRRKGWRKTAEKNELKAIIEEQKNYRKHTRWLIPMME
jgi:hypothetical protein